MKRSITELTSALSVSKSTSGTEGSSDTFSEWMPTKRRGSKVVADQQSPACADVQRKKGQPCVLHLGVKWQWLHVTMWHSKEEFPAHFPLGVKEISEVK